MGYKAPTDMLLVVFVAPERGDGRTAAVEGRR
jgi:hypothetical protein